MMLLSDLPNGTHATVTVLDAPSEGIDASTLRRLSELGFLPGEPVRLLRRGPGGREPLAVLIGETMFALRLLEAQCIEVTPCSPRAEAAMPRSTRPHHAPPWSVALVGNPNCGKTALFNLLTGARQKVANYAGVTVERKVGLARLADGRTVIVIDLPGAYSLTPATPDEQITLEVIEGRRPRRGGARRDRLRRRRDQPAHEPAPGARAARARPADDGRAQHGRRRARRRARDRRRRARARARLPGGRDGRGAQPTATPALLALLEARLGATSSRGSAGARTRDARRRRPTCSAKCGASSRSPRPAPSRCTRFQHRIDAVVLHPVWGLLLLGVVLFLMFQAVFSWADLPMDAIKAAMAGLGDWITAHMAEGPLRSLLVDGVIAGVGSVLVFLPQILILFFFILAARGLGLPAARRVPARPPDGQGRACRGARSFRCCRASPARFPAIMATRTIANWRDRLATIMVAPLMTCSARLPVYALLIGAFVPATRRRPVQPAGPDAVRALRRRRRLGDGAWPGSCKRVWIEARYQPLMLELPPYRWPSLRNLAHRPVGARADLPARASATIIFSLMVVLWFLSSFPAPPAGATGPGDPVQPRRHARATRSQHVFAPIGFNWQISIALVPGLAAREVAVGALGTVYALSAAGDARRRRARRR